MVDKNLGSNLFYSSFVLIAVCLIMSAGIWVGYGIPPREVFPGLALYCFVCLGGVLLSSVVPGGFPAVGWVAVIGIVFSVPGFFPWSEEFVAWSDKIPFLATATPVLAYSGIAFGKDWGKFKKIGWRGILVSFLVFAGTFVGSAAVAEMILRLLD
jgi:hypothetical protein